MAPIMYPPAIKALAVKLELRGRTRPSIRRILGKQISRHSFARWKKTFRLTRSIIRDPHGYLTRGRRRKVSVEEQRYMETLVTQHPSLFLDEVREELYDMYGKMLSIATIQLELRARLLFTLKKAGVGNVRKCNVDKFRWVDTMMKFPANFLVFTGTLTGPQVSRLAGFSKSN